MGEGRVNKAVSGMELEGTQDVFRSCVDLVIGLRLSSFNFFIARYFDVEITKVEIKNV